MTRCIFLFIILFGYLLCFPQVTNYQIVPSNSLAVKPYHIYSSNDGNLLVSNSEINWDAGYSHVIKVKPNGDTIYSKSTNNEDLFVTSNGNILSCKNQFDPLFMTYVGSYITMHDKNLNIKWQIDLSGNFINNSPNIISAPIVTNFMEVNQNKYICSVVTYSNNGGPSGPQILDCRLIEFDSLGSINYIKGQLNEMFYFAGKCYNSWISYSNSLIYKINPNIVNNALGIYGGISNYKLRSVICNNNKIYLSSQNSTLHKAIISCMDSNFNVLWSKTIEPNDSTKNNYIEDLLYHNDKIICKYQDDTTSHILNFDTTGILLSANKLQLNSKDYITHLALLNDSLFTTCGNSNVLSTVKLIKMNTQGNYNCSSPSNFSLTTANFSMINGFSDSLRSQPLTYSLSPSNFFSNTYSITISKECIGTDLEKIYNHDDFITLVPNPTFDLVNVSSNNEIEKIELINTVGQVLFYNNVYSKTYQLQLYRYSEGVYFVRITYRNGLSVIKKIIKQ